MKIPARVATLQVTEAAEDLGGVAAPNPRPPSGYHAKHTMSIFILFAYFIFSNRTEVENSNSVKPN